MQSTYHAGDPAKWLDMPQWLLDVYAIMRPRLEAESLLAQFEVAAMASERVDTADRTRWLNSLKRTAGMQDARNKPRSVQDWAAQGMKVRRVPKQAQD